MDSSAQEQNASGVGCNSALTDCSKKLRAHFSPTQQRLQSTLELSQSLAAVLEGYNSLARHFNIPLASDTMAGKIDPLFGNLQLVKDDEGEVDNDIRWLDIVLAPTYKPERREDGYYYLQLDGRKGLIRVSEADHNFIESGLPQKLINPRSYPSDVQSEEDTMRVVEGLLLNLNELASQIIDANNDCRARISQRLGTLRQLSQNTRQIDDKSKNTSLQITGSPEPAKAKGVRKRKPRSTMPPWEPQELDCLPQWFQDHKHLTKKQVEAEFENDFGRFRTFGAIVTAQYRARNDHGKGRAGLKRKLHADDSLPPSIAIESDCVAVPDRTNPFSLASDSDARPSVSFLTPLRSLRSPETSSGGTTERQCPESSHQTTHTEAITQDTVERPLWNECPVSSTSRADMEDFDPTGNTCAKAKLLCEGYNLQKPIRPKELSTPRSQGNQYLQEDYLHHESPTDSLNHVVEGVTVADHHGLPGQQHSVSAPNKGSPWMPSSGSGANLSSPSCVSGQDAPGARGALTAANRLPPPINPDIGPQVMPPIDQVLNGQYMPSNQLAFPDWSPQP
ncbi:hypothetical protein BJX63DRAFT_416824 [Aspergillus granulosus]|uniref:Uncharacterized protein n=1 Tax=Aspergillus granulosus TaxID=176169 RepID=A0ABR4GRK9_9EURO